jgi:hypothetical protein
MGAKYPDAKDYSLDKDGLSRLFQSGRPVIVVMKEKRLPSFKEADIKGGAVSRRYEKRWLIANRTAAASSSSGR